MFLYRATEVELSVIKPPMAVYHVNFEIELVSSLELTRFYCREPNGDTCQKKKPAY